MQDISLLQSYESLKTEENLRGLIKDRVREGLYFEYKTKSDPKNPTLSDFDRKNLSKSLSSFANSEGGILIWGISTSKSGDTKLPKKLNPIKQVHEFEKRLNNFLPNAVQPPIANLRSEVVYKKNSKISGYIKYLVQPSDLTPHRSVSNDAQYDHYYARNSEGCYIMPHYQIADMFGRRVKPDLSLDVKTKDSPYVPGEKHMCFGFMNYGRAIAKYFGFTCSFDDNIELIITPDLSIQDMTELNDGKPTINYENNSTVIHPNGVHYRLGYVRYKRKNVQAKIKGKAIYYCEGMISKELNFEVD